MTSTIDNWQPGIRVLTVIVIAALLAGLGVWNEITTWQRLVLSSNNRLLETARAIGLHTDDVFALAEQPLAQLALKAQIVRQDQRPEAALLEDMQSLRRSSTLLNEIVYIQADGTVSHSRPDAMATTAELSLEEYSGFHRSHASTDTHIGTAVRSKAGKDWLLPVSRRIDAPDGSFAGVLLATIRLDHFARFIESFDLRGDTAFYLVHSEGGVLLRYPFWARSVEADLGDREFFQDQGPSKQQGNHEYRLQSGESRLSGYYYSPDTRVTAIVTRSKSALFHNWVTRSKYPWACLIAAYVVGLGITFRWLRQIRLREIGDRKVAAREAEFRLIANASSDVIEKHSMAGIREYVSPAAAILFEQAPETLIGTKVTDGQDEATRTAWISAQLRLQSGSSAETILAQRQRADGSVIWLESVLSCVRSENGAPADGIVVVTRDVTRQETAKRELDTLAVTDELTGLFNKRYFSQHLQTVLSESPGAPVSLLLLDLDRFKQFNDTYGHLPGDNCLRDVANAIRSALPESGAVAARFGGEEMAVLLPGFGQAASLLLAEKLRRAVEALKIAHEANAPSGIVTISIGLCVLPKGHSETSETLIVSADQALYEAKSQGRNRIALSAVPAPPLKQFAAV